MAKFLQLLLASFFLSFQLSAQVYSPVTVTGFNQDVVADGTGSSSLTTTSREMDAITPSNNVMCSRQFATANNFTPANTYGLPDNGTIVSGTRTFQMASYAANNALYMFPADSGKLFLTTPTRFTNLSMLVLGTEAGTAPTPVNVTFKFTDSTILAFNNQSFTDWFNTSTTNLALQGFGRIKRKSGPFVAGTDYEGGNLLNPHLYYLDLSLPCAKTLAYIIFKNVASTTTSSRAFVLAVSGVAGPTLNTPVVTPVTLCSAGAATLAVQSPQTGVVYNWYTAATGGFAFYTGNSYTTPVLSADRTYYVEVASTTGCTGSTRTPAVVTIGTRPAAPTVNNVSVCPNNTATLTISSPVTGITYNWYTVATGGTPVATGTSFTTPVIITSTTYYAEAVNTFGCASTTRTPVAVTFLPKLPSLTAQATSTGVTSVAFSWTAVAGATGYQVSVNGSAFGVPSSGATGTVHVATGLAPSSTVTFRVFAVGPQVCQNSDTVTVTIKTLTDEIYIPNVFTPNGDGKNDIFRAYGNSITGIDMKVFDQWGEVIFASTDFALGWNGTYKGKQQPVGVYIYVMKLRLADGREMTKRGSINLVR